MNTRLDAAANALRLLDGSPEGHMPASMRERYERQAKAALAAADSVEGPAVERLVAALADAEAMLVVAATFAHNVGQGASSLAFQHTAENAHAILAEFGQQPTGDEQ